MNVADRFSKLVSELFYPPVVTAATLLVAWAAVRNITLIQLLVALTSAVVVPLAVVTVGVARRSVTSHQVPVRQQRLGPGVIVLISVAVGGTILLYLRTPAPFVNVYFSGALCALILLVCTVRIKVSVHLGTIAAAAASLALFVDLSGLWLLAAAPLIAWARVRQRDHTPTEIGLGLILGAIVPCVYWLAVS